MKPWVISHWPEIAAALVILINEANRRTRHWSEYKSRAARAVAWLLELANVVILQARVPELKRPPVEPEESREELEARIERDKLALAKYKVTHDENTAP